MKTLIAVVAFATVFAVPIFAQSVNAWGWKGALAAPASAKSAYAAAFNNRRGVLSDRRGVLPGRGRRRPVRSSCPRDCHTPGSAALPAGGRLSRHHGVTIGVYPLFGRWELFPVISRLGVLVPGFAAVKYPVIEPGPCTQVFEPK